MKINHVHIDGFGKWHDQDFDFNANPTVVFGPNEAGKTTLANFILSILFGFADGRGKNRFQQYLPKDGAAYGGSLTITQEGQEYTIKRTKGKNGGKVTITDVNGHHKPVSFLNQLVGPLDRDLYRSIYSFGNQDLITDDLDQATVEKQLQQVGAVGSQEWLAQSQQLTKHADELYKPRGRKQPLVKHLKEYQELRGRLADARDQYAEYQELQHQEQSLTDQQTRLAEELPDLKQRVGKLEHLQRLWPVYQTWRAGQQQSQLQYQMSDETIAKVQGLQTSLAEVQRQLKDNQETVNRLSGQQTGLANEQVQDYQANKAKYQQLKDQLLTLQMKMQNQSAQQLVDWQRERSQIAERYGQHALPAPLTESDLFKLHALLEPSTSNQKAPVLVLSLVGVIMFIIGLVVHTSILTVLGLVVAIAGGAWYYWTSHQNAESQSAAINDFGEHHGLSAFPSNQWVSMQADLHRYQDLERQIQASQQSTATLNHQLQDLRRQLPRVVQGSDDEALINNYRQWLVQIEDQAQQAGQLGRELSREQDRGAHLQEQASTMTKQLADYYQQVDVHDADGFSRYLATRAAAQKRAVTQSAYDQQLSDQDKQLLAQYDDEAGLSRDLSAAHQALAANQQQNEEIATRMANLKVRIGDLVKNGTYSQLQQKQANLETVIWQESRQWLTYQLAIKWIQHALQLASADRFPKIVHQAEQFFATLTSGHYAQILLDDQGIQVIDDDQQTFQVEELSLGTAEQLFIALRLGFVVVIADQLKLPILIDDGFVNFDQVRRQKMLAILQQLANRQQVIYFTADERALSWSAAVVDLSENE